jgi:ferric-dicitrate binding protein FerR (iron transport regulator)
MIKPKLHHVTFKTSRLDEMIAWYGTVIGAKVQFRDQVAAWTSNDDANHRIAFLAVPGLSDDERKIQHNGMRAPNSPLRFSILRRRSCVNPLALVRMMIVALGSGIQAFPPRSKCSLL